MRCVVFGNFLTLAPESKLRRKRETQKHPGGCTTNYGNLELYLAERTQKRPAEIDSATTHSIEEIFALTRLKGPSVQSIKSLFSRPNITPPQLLPTYSYSLEMS